MYHENFYYSLAWTANTRSKAKPEKNGRWPSTRTHRHNLRMQRGRLGVETKINFVYLTCGCGGCKTNVTAFPRRYSGHVNENEMKFILWYPSYPLHIRISCVCSTSTNELFYLTLWGVCNYNYMLPFCVWFPDFSFSLSISLLPVGHNLVICFRLLILYEPMIWVLYCERMAFA